VTQAQAHGAQKAYVLILPDARTVMQQMEKEPPYLASLHAFLASRRIDCIDLTGDFAAEAHTAGLKRLFKGMHYSFEGNRVVQRALARALLGRH
jgi:hypothetical protein